MATVWSLVKTNWTLQMLAAWLVLQPLIEGVDPKRNVSRVHIGRTSLGRRGKANCTRCSQWALQQWILFNTFNNKVTTKISPVSCVVGRPSHPCCQIMRELQPGLLISFIRIRYPSMCESDTMRDRLIEADNFFKVLMLVSCNYGLLKIVLVVCDLRICTDCQR